MFDKGPLFDKGRETYKSDIKLGEKYRDNQTGVEGIATAVYFYQYACERVVIEYLKPDRELAELVFDAPRLTHITSGVTASSTKTGGPGRATETRTAPSRR